MTPDVLKELVPGGKLRAAINVGNVVLAHANPTGAPTGITPDLAHELGRRLNVPVELVVFDGAGKVFAAANSGAWDIAFLAIEPKRAAELEFTAPYVLIEGTYMVPANSPLRKVEDVDRSGLRIAVNPGSAYDLYLARTLKHASLVRGEDGPGASALDLFAAGKVDAIAGVRQPLDAYAKSHGDVHVMDGRFMDIQQAMAAGKGLLAGAAFLKDFVEDVKASGFVAQAILRNNQSAAVAPPAR